MGLPFRPEPVESIRERLPRAFETTFDVESILLGLAVGPGGKRSQVFDFPDGMRAICSKEQPVTRNGTILHISVSVHGRCSCWACLSKEAIEAFKEILPETPLYAVAYHLGVIHLLDDPNATNCQLCW